MEIGQHPVVGFNGQTFTIVLIVTVWMFVLVWYMTWGLWLVPYRIIRRGQRKQKVDQLRPCE